MPCRWLSRYVFGLLALPATACDLLDSPPVICTSSFLMGLHVSVQDSLTGAPAASGAMLIARDGAYSDTATVPFGNEDPDRGMLMAAGERPGTYIVTVRKDGYLTWDGWESS